MLQKNQILAKTTPFGIKISFRNKNYELKYPKEIWQKYPDKEIFMNNYVPLATISLPLMLNLKKIYYNVSEPLFQNKFQQLMLKDLPSSTYDNKQDAIKLAQKFLDIKYEFEKNKLKQNKIISKSISNNYGYRSQAVLPLSLGKDSLLTLGVAREIGLNPGSIYVNDTVSPTENKLKLKLGKKLARKLGQKHQIITNKIEKLNDFETWNKPESNFNYSHMVTGFCFIALPFVYHYNAKYIILGNEQDMNFSFRNNGVKAWPAYDQTSLWQKEQDKMIKKMTAGKTQVTSLIRPLTNIAIVKILHHRYPKIAKYEVSCDCLDASNEKRWCHSCNKCARLFLFMKAFGFDPKSVGLRNMLGKKHEKLYSLFNGKEVDRYEQNIESKEQQLLAFLFAYRSKARGYLIDYFKKYYLKEAEEKEQQLRVKYFKIWPAQLPRELRRGVFSIYREELKDLA